MMAIASLLTNAFKTVQPSAKDKEDTYRRADARQGYLTQDFTLREVLQSGPDADGYFQSYGFCQQFLSVFQNP